LQLTEIRLCILILVTEALGRQFLSNGNKLKFQKRNYCDKVVF